MLSQDIIQVYANEDGDAVVVVGAFEGVENPVSLNHIIIPMREARSVAYALSKLAELAEQELE